MKKFLLGVLVGFVCSAVAAVITIFAFVRVATRPPAVPSTAVLVVRIQGSVPERPGVESPLPSIPFLTPTQAPTVRDYWELFRKASADGRIRAILLAPESLQAGWAKLDELRAGIEQFRGTGRPVYAFLRAPRTREYYLAAAADRVYMAPEDVLDMKGLRVEMMYFRNLLDKIGVNVVIAHAGKYKDAPEMFTRTGPSEPALDMTVSLLDGLYGQIVSVIGKARKKSAADVMALLNQGPFLAQQALGAGLVDSLKYEEEVTAELQSRLRLRSLDRFEGSDYMRVPAADAGLRLGSRIAFVAASGSIVRSTSDGLLAGVDLMSADEMRGLLRRVREDSGIRGVIVRIDSPGGDSFASDEIWHDMRLLSKKKPLVISMSDEAASGGYYIAMTGDPIVAYPATYTGSIGVFYGKANLRGLYDKIGITKEVVSRGRFADLDSDYVPLSPAGREKLDSLVMETYQAFLERVSQARRMPVAKVDEVAQGRVWLGSQARTNGLVDQLGGIDLAVEIVKQKAGIPKSERVRLVSYPARRGFLEWLTGRPEQPSIHILSAVRQLSTVQWLRGGLFYMPPYTIAAH